MISGKKQHIFKKKKTYSFLSSSRTYRNVGKGAYASPLLSSDCEQELEKSLATLKHISFVANDFLLQGERGGCGEEGKDESIEFQERQRSV